MGECQFQFPEFIRHDSELFDLSEPYFGVGTLERRVELESNRHIRIQIIAPDYTIYHFSVTQNEYTSEVNFVSICSDITTDADISDMLYYDTTTVNSDNHNYNFYGEIGDVVHVSVATPPYSILGQTFSTQLYFPGIALKYLLSFSSTKSILEVQGGRIGYDLALSIQDSDGNVLAYNDDAEQILYSPFDPTIAYLQLPRDDTYTINVTSVNSSTGFYMLNLLNLTEIPNTQSSGRPTELERLPAIITTTSRLNLRHRPTLISEIEYPYSSVDNVMTVLNPNDRVKILFSEGVQADGYNWILVSTENGYLGWIADSLNGNPTFQYVDAN